MYDRALALGQGNTVDTLVLNQRMRLSCCCATDWLAAISENFGEPLY